MSDDEAKAQKHVGKELCATRSNEIDNFNAGAYAGAGSFRDDGVYAAAGVGYVRAEDGILEVEFRGPTFGVEIGASEKSSVRAGVKAELASASVTVGLVKATLGLAADTGFNAGPSGMGIKVLGTGASIGRTTSISLFGSSIEWNWW